MTDRCVQVSIDGSSAGIARAARDASSALGDMEKSANTLTSSMFSLRGTLASIGITAVVGQAVQAAAAMERANIGLAVTARYAGAGLNETLQAARNLTKDGLISLTDASQALQNLLSRGFSLDQAITMMNRLKDSAAFNRQAHLEFGQAIVGATEGLKNENSVLVDNAGVTKNVSVMWKEYAAETGKTVDNLSQAEKRQAEYNGILRETEAQLGNAARMTNTFAGAQARLAKELNESKAAMGTAMLPVMADVAKALVPITKGFRDFIGMYQSGIVAIAAFVDKALAVYNKGGILGLLFSSAKRKDLGDEFGRIDQAASETKDDIFKRLNAPELPDIGADSGKRRQDIKSNKKPARVMQPRSMFAGYDLLPEEKSGADWLREAVARDEEMWRIFAGASLYTDPLPELPKLTVGGKAFAAQNKSSRTYSLLGPGGAEDFMVQWAADKAVVVQTWREQMELEKIFYDYKEEQRRLDLERQREVENMRVSVGIGTFQYLGDAANTFYAMSKHRSKAALEVYRAASATETLIGTYKGAQNAFVDGSKINYWVGVAYATAATVAGLARVAAIYSSGSSGGSIGTPSGGYGAGTPTSPLVTQPTTMAVNSAPPQINITVQGHVIGQDRWVEEHLAPTIRELVTRRNVDFGMVPA